MKSNKKAFTLIEILVVLGILGFIVIVQLIILMGKQNQYGASYFAVYNSLKRATYNVLADIYCPECYTTAGSTPACTGNLDNYTCINNARVFPETTGELCRRLAGIEGDNSAPNKGFINTAENNCVAVEHANQNANAINPQANNFSDNTVQFISTNGQKFYISEPMAIKDATEPNSSSNLRDNESILNYFIVYVDLNGNNRPNRLVCDGTDILPDIVPFAVTERGDVIPIGYPTYSKYYLSASIKRPTDTQSMEYSEQMTYKEAVSRAWPSRQAGTPYRYENIPYTLMFDSYGKVARINNVAKYVDKFNLIDIAAFNRATFVNSNIVNSGCPGHNIPNALNPLAREVGTNGDCRGDSYTCRAVINKYTTSRY